MDKIAKSKRSDIMRRIKSKGSKIEIVFGKALWKAGYRYRKNPKRYFGKPDFVLRKRKTVIFIDSCFWHGCKEHCRIPTTRQDYWIPKIERNKKRGGEVNRHYANIGWKVLRVWEHEISEDLMMSVKRVVTAINKNQNKEKHDGKK